MLSDFIPFYFNYSNPPSTFELISSGLGVFNENFNIITNKSIFFV